MSVSETLFFKLAGDGDQRGLKPLVNLLERVNRPAFVVVHETRTIAWVNSAATRVFGYEAGDLLGRSTRVLHVDSNAYSEFGEASSEIVARERPFRTRFEMRRKDGRRFVSDHLVIPVVRQAGYLFAVSLVTDLSASMAEALGERVATLLGDTEYCTPGDTKTAPPDRGEMLNGVHGCAGVFAIERIAEGRVENAGGGGGDAGASPPWVGHQTDRVRVGL